MSSKAICVRLLTCLRTRCCTTRFPRIGGVVHTHSHFGTVWAQAAREIPCFGTTHADYFHGPIPVTDALTKDEIASEYEANTGHAIVRRFVGIDPLRVPAVLVAGHASFAWGRNVGDAVEMMSVMEEVAELAFHTLALNAAATSIASALHDKHFCGSTGRRRTTDRGRRSDMHGRSHTP